VDLRWHIGQHRRRSRRVLRQRSKLFRHERHDVEIGVRILARVHPPVVRVGGHQCFPSLDEQSCMRAITTSCSPWVFPYRRRVWNNERDRSHESSPAVPAASSSASSRTARRLTSGYIVRSAWSDCGSRSRNTSQPRLDKADGAGRSEPRKGGTADSPARRPGPTTVCLTAGRPTMPVESRQSSRA
jgi:hypothetical protein